MQSSFSLHPSHGALWVVIRSVSVICQRHKLLSDWICPFRNGHMGSRASKGNGSVFIRMEPAAAPATQLVLLHPRQQMIVPNPYGLALRRPWRSKRNEKKTQRHFRKHDIFKKNGKHYFTQHNFETSAIFYKIQKLSQNKMAFHKPTFCTM